MAALVCLALANAPRATADDQDTSKSTRNYNKTTTETRSTQSTEGTPAKFNKASGIIGMAVRNQNDEQLGHIKDLVIDPKTEKISYAVMSTAPKALLGINEKLLAVPLSAFTISSDEKHLVLNADKAKVEAAAGFDKNSWPSVSSPSWGAEPFWQTSDTGVSGKTEVRTPRSTTTTPEK